MLGTGAVPGAEPGRGGAGHSAGTGHGAGSGDLDLLAGPIVRVEPWLAPDRLGHDPRSEYVETYWLGVLGPSTTWLVRHLAAGLERQPGGFDLDTDVAARSLGIGHRGGRHSPLARAFRRCVTFDLARPTGPARLAVRRRLPALSRRQVLHLPAPLQESHRRWTEETEGLCATETMRSRARQLALSLLEIGEDAASTERQLLRWAFHPAMAREASAWARAYGSRPKEAASSTRDRTPKPVAPFRK